MMDVIARGFGSVITGLDNIDSADDASAVEEEADSGDASSNGIEMDVAMADLRSRACCAAVDVNTDRLDAESKQQLKLMIATSAARINMMMYI